MTGWINNHVGIAIGCTNLLIPFVIVIVIQVILDATSGVTQGPRLSKEIRMPPLKAFLDDMTIPVLTEDHARAMLSWLDKLIRW